MPKDAKHPKNWHEALELITRCPVCQTAFDPKSARLVSRDDRANKVHLSCKQCGSYALVVIAMLPRGISSVGMITDLSFDDVARLNAAGEITTDELIENYQILKTNTLSMARLTKIAGK